MQKDQQANNRRNGPGGRWARERTLGASDEELPELTCIDHLPEWWGILQPSGSGLPELRHATFGAITEPQRWQPFAPYSPDIETLLSI
ncbi:MAG: hypothetical protein ACR2HX_11145 [Pyrinomonadaceae bacterium]